MLWKTLTILVVGLLVGADEPKKKDEDLIQGTWAVVSLEKGGKAAPEEETKNFMLEFAADKFTLKGDNKDKEISYTLDATQQPKHITCMADGKTVPGIYSLKG